MYEGSVEQASGFRLREWIKGWSHATANKTTKHCDADMDNVALEHELSPKLDNFFQGGKLQKDISTIPPNGHSLTLPQCQELHRSQPVHIHVKRQLKEEEHSTASLPTIPNPFPELCSSSSSSALNSCPKATGHRGMYVVTIYSEDGMCRSLEVGVSVKASDVCHLLVQRNRCVDEESWTLVEVYPHMSLERYLEDHESLVEIQMLWEADSDSKFVFRKHFAKYEFFRNPAPFFPEQLVAGCLEANEGIPHSQLLRNFLNARRCPEIQGFIHVRDKGRKSWRRLYFFLRRSGVYYSTKGTSKEPRHLHYFADVSEGNIYTVTEGRKAFNAPTDFSFCIKPYRTRNGSKDLQLLCADDEQSRTCWMTAFRLFKLGSQLCVNYQLSQQRQEQQEWLKSSPPRNLSETSLVAMDFSGCTGRVIANPEEAWTVALEEGQTWRKKSLQRYSLPSPCQGSVLSAAIHRTQPWFHGRISREEAHRLIIQHGHVDGVFLMRESQRTPTGFVLTLSHQQKIKHFLVLLCEEDGQNYYSLDGTHTKFTDLIQLVDFYQINRGVLPCNLKHCCSRIPL
ncbi:growth factor receptor-bound protein 7 isoform X1 [Callorhinchus milii]|uniref:Growth factor receptor-bound protein 7-like protein n=2 Tax=Callorhinchus milii TaxID=7868 RepID=V9KP70_CALMI|nr:growth factor receptor-bound protein 7 isoform X1 [Callorhinchus milii]|eukprot:gi/632966815/ref/XP_007899628.1/ PREDICTED: growth factor receptor-bound protein 7 [Callorhinchus milii]